MVYKNARPALRALVVIGSRTHRQGRRVGRGGSSIVHIRLAPGTYRYFTISNSGARGPTGRLFVRAPTPSSSTSPAPTPPPVTADPSTPFTPPAPGVSGAGTVAVGAYVSISGLTSKQAVARREQQLGRTRAIDQHFYGWTESFPTGLEVSDLADGRTPMVAWLGTSLDAILSGSEDGLIRSRAADVRDLQAKIFIRWAPEMNGDWYSWSGPQNQDSPAKYVAAWRHIHDIFDAAGANNAIWVWAPANQSHPGLLDLTSWNNWRNYYPGNGYVDWVGIDGYNWGPIWGWSEFGEIFSPIYSDYAATKPIMIAETSSVEDGGSKAAWIGHATTWIKAHPAIRAVVWFDVDQSAEGVNWSIDSSAASLAAFKRLAQDPYFSARTH
ncbi:MAG: glycosyl hydrolase [Thermoleophilia bacterium]